MSDATTEALGHLGRAADHHERGRESHGEARDHISRSARLVERALFAARNGNQADVTARLKDLEASLSDAILTHGRANSDFSEARRACEDAARCLTRDAEPSEYVNPTKKAGAQGSDGQTDGSTAGREPRDSSPEAIRERIRQREQLAGCEYSHRARQDQLARLRR